MKAKRKKRISVFNVILLILCLALGTAAVLAYLNRSKPEDVPLPTPAPSPSLSPSPTPVAEVEELNPVASVLEGFETVWIHSFEPFEAMSLQDSNKAPLSTVRLALGLAYADMMMPAQKLQALTKSGTDHWTGESAQNNPLPAFITGSGEIYTFGINVQDIALSETQEQVEDSTPTAAPTAASTASSIASPTASPIASPMLTPTASPTVVPTAKPSPTPQVGSKLEGRCDIHNSRLAYSLYADGNLVCIVELVQTGAGYIGQIYRPSGAEKGVIRFYTQLSLISCALFPDMEKDDMISIYDDAAVTWEQLCEGADQVMTWTDGEAKLIIGNTVQHYR